MLRIFLIKQIFGNFNVDLNILPVKEAGRSGDLTNDLRIGFYQFVSKGKHNYTSFRTDKPSQKTV